MIQERVYLNVIMLWVQELTTLLIEDQYLLNHNSVQTLIECLKRISEDYAQNIPAAYRQGAN
jgi:hypothetical protein